MLESPKEEIWIRIRREDVDKQGRHSDINLVIDGISEREQGLVEGGDDQKRRYGYG
jgi:hypothetical protein